MCTGRDSIGRKASLTLSLVRVAPVNVVLRGGGGGGGRRKEGDTGDTLPWQLDLYSLIPSPTCEETRGGAGMRPKLASHFIKWSTWWIVPCTVISLRSSTVVFTPHRPWTRQTSVLTEASRSYRLAEVISGVGRPIEARAKTADSALNVAREGVAACPILVAFCFSTARRPARPAQ